jgi:hypothetical protein
MIPIREALYFPKVHNLFDEKGNITGLDFYQKKIKIFLAELVWYAQAITAAQK